MESIEIFKCPTKWIVKIGVEVITYSNIDDAFDFVETLGIKEDEADAAIIAMFGNNHTRASFGVIEGNFLFSDVATPPYVGSS
jgi:hypothetical protein